MSEDMRYWKAAATTKISSFKGYLAPKDHRPSSPRYFTGESPAGGNVSLRQTWGQWAGNKLRRRSQNQESNGLAVEKISLFPGWAARRFHNKSLDMEGYFDVEVFVSGYASRVNNPEFMSRSQRAFLRLAKGFASIPKLKDSSATLDSPLSKSEEELLTAVPQTQPPSEVYDEAAEAQALDEHFQRSDDKIDITSTSHNPSKQQYLSASFAPSSPNPQSRLRKDLHELHANIEARLQPFWATSLSNRTVRISLYTSEEVFSVVEALSTEVDGYEDPSLGPLTTCEVTTAQDGSFQVKIPVPWQALCTHPTGVHVAFGDLETDHNLYVRVELLPAALRPTLQTGYRQSPDHFAPQPSSQIPVSESSISIPLTFAPVRIVSDIDDTVKLANVSQGARAVFSTVFVKKLSDMIIPDMAEWYTDMWRRGARFHYVSNGPYEILPVLHEFFELARLPPGSIKLRSYGGRSLFNGLLSAPMTRKRQGVIDLLTSFPESRFVLIGDSGEQDLELYASLSTEYPEQVLAILIRDVRLRVGNEEPIPLEDPTGSQAIFRKGNRSSPSLYSPKVLRDSIMIRRTNSDTPPRITPGQISRSSSGSALSGMDEYFTPSSGYPSPRNEHWTESQIVEEPERFSGSGSGQRLTDMEWKRSELQWRVDRARLKIPNHIFLRIFRSPEECIETKRILDEQRGEPLKPKQDSGEQKMDKTGILVDI